MKTDGEPGRESLFRRRADYGMRQESELRDTLTSAAARRLRLCASMPNVPIKSTYCEPTVMWRLSHPDGRWAHAIIVPRGSQASAMWFINGRPEHADDFENWKNAIKWIEGVRRGLKAGGWRQRE